MSEITRIEETPANQGTKNWAVGLGHNLIYGSNNVVSIDYGKAGGPMGYYDTVIVKMDSGETITYPCHAVAIYESPTRSHD